MAVLWDFDPPSRSTAAAQKGSDRMLTWISVNLINIALIAVIVLIAGLLIRSMIRDKKAGNHSCGGNCASCGACGSCSACGRCGTIPKQANSDLGS